jgi:UDP-N-acetyl-D-mannosaminuronic acid dehydrogenase
MTKHDQYKSINPAKLKHLLRTKVIVDGRNMFDAGEFTSAGFIFKGVGKGNVNDKARVNYLD